MNDSDHPRENPVSRIAISLFKELSSAALPGSGIFVDVLQEFKRKKIAEAQQILLDDLKDTIRELSDIEKDEFVPIAYLFFKAADEGLAKRNVKLLSKLIRDEINSETISYDHYASAAHVAKLLTIEEIAALSTFLKRIPRPQTAENGDNIYDISREHYQDIEKTFIWIFQVFLRARKKLYLLSLRFQERVCWCQ
jgi:hypothetical protein